MYQFLLRIEQGHFQLLSKADIVLINFIHELSGKIRNPAPIKHDATVQQRHLHIKTLLEDFIQYKQDFITQFESDWNTPSVNNEVKQSFLNDSMNRYYAEIIRIKSELNTM